MSKDESKIVQVAKDAAKWLQEAEDKKNAMVVDATKKIGYGLGYVDATINEFAIPKANDQQIVACDKMADIPVLGALSAPGCQAVKDVVAKRGK